MPMKRALSALVLALLLGLAACAPGVQLAGRPDAAFQGPRLESDVFVSSDGTRLPLTRWAPAEGDPRAVIIALHGMNSHAGAFRQAGPYWARHGILTLAWDQRGFGRNRAQHGVWAGEDLLTEDLRVAVTLARAAYPRATIAVVGVSMGGSVAIEAFASDRPPAADRLLLLSPGIWGLSQLNAPSRTGIWVAGHAAGRLHVRPPGWAISRFPPSDNEEEVRAGRTDPLVIWSMRPDSLYGLFRLMQDASTNIGRIRTPVAYLYGAHDTVMPASAARIAAARLPPGARTAYYENGWHWLLLDRQAPVVWADVESFILDPAAPWPSGAGPIPAP